MLETVLFLGGLAGLAFGLLMQRRSHGGSIKLSTGVNADHGSVAVGGDNNAPITVSTHASPSPSQSAGSSLFWAVWSIASGLASFVGLAITLWQMK